MTRGAITSYIDVAQLALYAFFVFFAFLLLYLRREDKREGYPLQSDRAGSPSKVEGLPGMPSPKFFRLSHGGVVSAPREEVIPPVAAEPVARWPGAPLQPTGNPMVDGVGPAAYAMRSDEPDLAFEDDLPKIVPLRAAAGFSLALGDADPRGMAVEGLDRKVAGTVCDAWVDRSDMLVRYLEVEVAGQFVPRRVLVPMTLVTVDGKARTVRVSAVRAAHFAEAPVTRHPEQVTLREEDRISAYFASGFLYATPGRLGPAL